MNNLARSVVDRLRSALEHLADHHAAPELLVAVVVMTGWAAAGFADFGFFPVIAAVVFGWILHGVAVETGGFGWLWLSTGVVLLYIVFARSTVLSGTSPIWMAAAGATALLYNEAVRSNHWRRRQAKIGVAAFTGSASAALAAGLLGVAGVAAADVVADGAQSGRWWQPLAAVTLFALAVSLLVLPTVRSPASSRERWTPGTRLPAPPKAPNRGNVEGNPQGQSALGDPYNTDR